MIVEERRQKVLDIVARRGFISLAELSLEVDASESTIRRDLDFWDKQGVLRRTHGGAVHLVVDGQGLPPLEERTSRQTGEKQAIAQAAAARIQDGDAVLLDGGTTTLEIARLLVGRPVQIVTNSLPIANLFANNHETDLVIVGGYVYPRTGVALGPLTTQMLENVHVHQTILSCSGITAKGLFNSNLLLVETQRQMMAAADEVVVVADSTKFGKQSLAFLCEQSAIDTLIVDAGLTPAQRGHIDETQVRLIVADGNGEEFRQ